MAEPLIVRGKALEGAYRELLYRATNARNQVIVESQIDSVDFHVYNASADDPETPLLSLLGLSPVGIVFPALQTGPEWDDDDVGYNVRYPYDPIALLIEEHGNETWVYDLALHQNNGFACAPLVFECEIVPRKPV